MNKINNKAMLAGFLVVTIVMMCVSVSGFGVSSTYSTAYPLRLAPGETKDIQFALIASAGDTRLVLSAEQIEGQDIAEITDSDLEYEVSVSEDTFVNVRVTAPKTEGRYSMKFRFTDVTPSDEGKLGTVMFRGATDFGVDVFVEEPPPVVQPVETPQPAGEGTPFWVWLLIIIIIVIIVIIVIIIIKKKKSGIAGKPMPPAKPPVKPATKPVTKPVK